MLRYVHPQSPSCIKVLLAAEMLKLPLQREVGDLMQGAQCRRPIRSYVVSDEVRLADIAIAGSLMYAEAAQMLLEPFRPVRCWFDGIRVPPAWSAAQPGGVLL